MSEGLIYKFLRPPVHETILGVQFNRIPKLHNVHLGAFWKSIGEDWPIVKESPEIEPQFERFDDGNKWNEIAGIKWTVSAVPHFRAQFINRTQDRMIQIQNGRFHFNWLKKTDEYPHYVKVRHEFDVALSKFANFLEAESLGAIEPNQWEVTYVNRIEKGSVWSNPTDWRELFSQLVIVGETDEIVRLESLNGEWHYEIPPKRGRLHVQIRHGRDDNGEVLFLHLTARGSAGKIDDLGSGLDLGRETIVRTFKALTSNAAHKYWGLQQ